MSTNSSNNDCRTFCSSSLFLHSLIAIRKSYRCMCRLSITDDWVGVVSVTLTNLCRRLVGIGLIGEEVKAACVVFDSGCIFLKQLVFCLRKGSKNVVHLSKFSAS